MQAAKASSSARSGSTLRSAKRTAAPSASPRIRAISSQPVDVPVDSVNHTSWVM